MAGEQAFFFFECLGSFMCRNVSIFVQLPVMFRPLQILISMLVIIGRRLDLHDIDVIGLCGDGPKNRGISLVQFYRRIYIV